MLYPVVLTLLVMTLQGSNQFLSAILIVILRTLTVALWILAAVALFGGHSRMRRSSRHPFHSAKPVMSEESAAIAYNAGAPPEPAAQAVVLPERAGMPGKLAQFDIELESSEARHRIEALKEGWLGKIVVWFSLVVIGVAAATAAVAYWSR